VPEFDIARYVQPGDGVVWGQACAEPVALVETFLAGRNAYPGARVFLGIGYAGTVRAEHADRLRFVSYCASGTNRALVEAGAVDILPVPYSRLGAALRSGALRADVLLVQVSPPNARGEYSLGLAADYLAPALDVCRTVIAEVNEHVPWTYSEPVLTRDRFAACFASSRAPVEAPPAQAEARARAIAQHALGCIPAGATVEAGIGGLPDAVLAALPPERVARLHTGALGDGAIALLESGIAADCALVCGSRALHAAVRENPNVRLRSCEYTHDAAVLGGIARFTAINAAVEVDLTGQINAEVAAGRYVGAVGGALDFVRAANRSPGGISLTLVPAERIVAQLCGPVTVPRSEAGLVVTEYGVADLREASLRERAQRLIAIAAPERRDALQHAARTAGLAWAVRY